MPFWPIRAGRAGMLRCARRENLRRADAFSRGAGASTSEISQGGGPERASATGAPAAACALRRRQGEPVGAAAGASAPPDAAQAPDAYVDQNTCALQRFAE